MSVLPSLLLLAAARAGSSTSSQPQCELVPATDMGPSDIGRAAATSDSECCALCSARLGCSAWTLYQGQCYMKSGTAGRKACAACSSGLPPPCSGFGGAASCPPPRCAWGGAREGCSAAAPLPPWVPPAELPPKWEMSGVTFTGGRYCPNVTLGSAAAQGSLAHLASTGATWVAIVATQYQWSINDTAIFPLHNGSAVRDVTSGYYDFVTPAEAQVTAAIRQARALGLKVMLKPHVDLLRDEKPVGRFWRGDIGGCPASWGHPPPGVVPFTAAQWEAWFASYRQFLAPYAALAEREGVEMLAINTELYCANKQQGQWRKVVAATREVFSSGLLTVAAIAGHEEEMGWWDAVDVIGIDA